MSHGQLLVRSPKAPASPSLPEELTNFDLSFHGVEYVAMPKILRGLELVGPTSSEVDLLSEILGRPIGIENLFILQSGGQRFSVVAAGATVSENNWDIFESPFEFRCHFRKE